MDTTFKLDSLLKLVAFLLSKFRKRDQTNEQRKEKCDCVFTGLMRPSDA